jgi:hypothetical protein
MRYEALLPCIHEKVLYIHEINPVSAPFLPNIVRQSWRQRIYVSTTSGGGAREGTVLDHGRPSISGLIRSTKMYSYAQCTVQERLVCSGDVPFVAQEEQGFPPSPWGAQREHLPPSPSTWVVGTQFTGSLQEGWTWTVKWTLFAASPASTPCCWIMYVILLLSHFSICTWSVVKWLVA